MDEGLDTGPVIARCQLPIEDSDTTASLTLKLSQVAANLLTETLPWWVDGELTPMLQDESCATYSSSLSRKDGEINWRLPALTIWRRVRAFQPWPGAYTRWRGKPLPKTGSSETGRVIKLDESPCAAPFGVITGEGVLGVLSLQLEGRRAMPASEFMRGQRELIGSVLPS